MQLNVCWYFSTLYKPAICGAICRRNRISSTRYGRYVDGSDICALDLEPVLFAACYVEGRAVT